MLSLRGIALALTLTGMLCACSKETDGDDGDDFSKALTTEEKVAALSLYVPWANLREAVDLAAETTSQRATNTDAAELADSLRRLCHVQKSPSTSAASKAARVVTIEIGPSGQKSQCPVSFHLRSQLSHVAKGPGSSETSGSIEVSFKANANATALTPLLALHYKGSSRAMTAPSDEGSGLIHDLKESFKGEAETHDAGRVPVEYEREATTRFRGTDSEVRDRIVRKGKFSAFSAEWRQERILDDLKPREVRHYLNNEEVPSAEYEKLRKAARPPRGF